MQTIRRGGAYVDAGAILRALDIGAVVLLSPFGFSPTGEAFNLTMEEVATSTAIALQADKLLFMTEVPGIHEVPTDAETPIICNGFKDAEFIEMAMLAQKMGRKVIPVVEKYTELALILKYAEKVGVRPQIGMRIKLAARGSGRLTCRWPPPGRRAGSRRRAHPLS